MRGLRFPWPGYALPALPPKKKKRHEPEVLRRQKIVCCVKQLHNGASSCNATGMSTAEISVTCVTNLRAWQAEIECHIGTKIGRILCRWRASHIRSMCYSLAQVLGTYKINNGIDGGEAEFINKRFRAATYQERVHKGPIQFIAAAKVERVACAGRVAGQ